MAPHGVAITMACPWQGKMEEFSNVFHYELDAPFAIDSGWHDLATNVAALMKPAFGSVVEFRRYRVYGPTNGTKAENVMKAVGDLTGFGSASTGTTTLAPEFAVVIQKYIGRGPAGGKQFLRKFLHVNLLKGGTGQTGQANATAALTSLHKDPYITIMQALSSVSVGGSTNVLCSPNGKLHNHAGASWTVNDYVQTRQFTRG